MKPTLEVVIILPLPHCVLLLLLLVLLLLLPLLQGWVLGALAA
jgi:hypothetical protein